MSKISLKHSGGNVVSLNSPPNAPGSPDVAFRLPNQDGSANEVLKTDGSGNLAFATIAGGKFASYAILVDQKTSGTNGGSFTSGDWRTRDLNTEIADPDGIVSISSNQFTLQAGSYLIKAHAPAYKVGRHQIALYDITASSYVDTGSSAYVDGGESVQTDSFLTARFTCSGANVYEIRHQCGTGFNTYGFGVSILNSFAAPAENNYLTVLILKES